jgi:hypothetical protein
MPGLTIGNDIHRETIRVFLRGESSRIIMAGTTEAVTNMITLGARLTETILGFFKPHDGDILVGGDLKTAGPE